MLRRTVLVAGEWAMEGLYAVQLDKAASRAYMGSRMVACYIDDKTERR